MQWYTHNNELLAGCIMIDHGQIYDQFFDQFISKLTTTIFRTAFYKYDYSRHR